MANKYTIQNTPILARYWHRVSTLCSLVLAPSFHPLELGAGNLFSINPCTGLLCILTPPSHSHLEYAHTDVTEMKHSLGDYLAELRCVSRAFDTIQTMFVFEQLVRTYSADIPC